MLLMETVESTEVDYISILGKKLKRSVKSFEQKKQQEIEESDDEHAW